MTEVKCARCSAEIDIPDGAQSYECPYCHAQVDLLSASGTVPTPHSLQLMAERAIARNELGRAMQFIEQGLSIDPHHLKLLQLESNVRQQLATLSEAEADVGNYVDTEMARLQEAEQYKLQAEFILHSLQANIQVYGSNSAFTGATPADVDLALKYIDRSLELYPDNAAYLNLKALFLNEGKGDKQSAIALLERAHDADPRNITIKDNLEKLRESAQSACFIATAAHGTQFAWQIDEFRAWRDQGLQRHKLGRELVRIYYRYSPPLARFIARGQFRRFVARTILYIPLSLVRGRY